MSIFNHLRSKAAAVAAGGLVAVVLACVDESYGPSFPSYMLCTATPSTATASVTNGKAAITIDARPNVDAVLDSIRVDFGDGTATTFPNTGRVIAPNRLYTPGTRTAGCLGFYQGSQLTSGTAQFTVLASPGATLPTGLVPSQWWEMGRSNVARVVLNPSTTAQRVDSLYLNGIPFFPVSMRGDTAEVTVPTNHPALMRGSNRLVAFASNTYGTMSFSDTVRAYKSITSTLRCAPTNVAAGQTIRCAEHITDDDSLRSRLNGQLTMDMAVYKQTSHGDSLLASIPAAQMQVVASTDSLVMTFSSNNLPLGANTVRGTTNYKTHTGLPAGGTANVFITKN